MNSAFKIYGAEGLYVEYKERLPRPDALAKMMISFSNTKGGRIIMGVKDESGEICGIETKIDVEEYIMNIASENCDPIISPIVELHSQKDKLLVVIDVPAGALKPYHLKGKSAHQSTFIRIGSTNRLADRDHLQRLMREATNETFDRLPVANTSIDDIDPNKIEKYQELKRRRLGAPKEKTTDAFLKKIGVKTAASARSPVTYGGLLVFGKEVQSSPSLSRAHIKVGRFKGKEMGTILDHDILEGTLDKQIEDASHFIRKHMFVSGVIAGLKREDKTTYPSPALREIITNAVIHRDYSRASSESIMCRIFDDRLEVESPGLLPLGVRVENLGSVQNTRNPLIARLLFDMNYFDEWGQGINRIRSACKENGNPPPQFHEGDCTFKVTIYAPPRQLRYPLKERQKLLVDHLTREGEIRSSTYQSLTGISSAQAAKDFQHFLNERILIRLGKGRSVKYMLHEKNL